MKIGIVSCDDWLNKISEDLNIKNYLISQGIDAEIFSWQDENVNYSQYSCLLLRSVWGYQNEYEKFKKWLLYLKSNNIQIYNNVDLILNNIRKDIQFGILDINKIPHIPTIFMKGDIQLNHEYIPFDKAIVKPIISGSGNNTFHISESTAKNEITESDIPIVFQKIIDVSDNGLMFQQYISGVEDGEYSCIFIDGKNTHNMLRFPGIFAKKQRPLVIKVVPKEIMKLAISVSNIPEFKDYLYMRVDIVNNHSKALIMEVELAEPDLLTKYINNEEIKNNIYSALTTGLIRRLIK